MKPTLVLDCSITMAWCFADESTPGTEGVQHRFASESPLLSRVGAIFRHPTARVSGSLSNCAGVIKRLFLRSTARQPVACMSLSVNSSPCAT